MREEEELIEEAQRSRAETARLRGDDPPDEEPPPESPLPEKHDPEPWAKTSSGDADSVTDDD